MARCYECNKKIDLESEAFYPYNDNELDEYGEPNLCPHELCDTPFCEACTVIEAREIEKGKNFTINFEGAKRFHGVK